MHAYAATGAGFLIAVLWFDLMFDIQTHRHAGPTLPAEVLASIRAYYRRVTTEAGPMSRLIAAVMLATLAALIAEIATAAAPAWIGWSSLALTASAVGLAIGRTVRNAVRLGGGRDEAAIQSHLARSIYRDHVFCIGAMTLVAALQLAAGC